MNFAIAMLDLVSVLIELILLGGNIFGKHKINIKNKMYILSLYFFMSATIIHMFWNRTGSYTHSLLVGKIFVSLPYILSFVGEAFMGYYIVALIDERKKRNFFNSAIILFLSIIGIIFIIWGTSSGLTFYYYNHHMYQGPLYRYCLISTLFLGLFEIYVIISNYSVLGLEDTVVCLSYYILPFVSILVRMKNAKYNMIFGAIAVSMLVINNLLLSKEKDEAILSQTLAEEAEKNKSSFLANMSHEIRTPINAVLGLNEMILRESNDSTIIGYAQDVKSAGTTLLSLVNDVLDFSKIESGKMELVETDYEISSVLNDIVNMTNAKAVSKGLSFELEIDPTLPRILHGDEVRIKQIITNLLSNGVKYTENGYVKLTAGYEKIDEFAINLRVSVSDSGMGMKQEDIDRLFTPFSRLNEMQTRHIEGTGLGMAITKHFLGLMNSKLEVSSVYGEGSIFSFTIRQEVNNWECMGNYQEAFKKIREKKSDYKVKLRAKDARVLIVDDMPMNLTVCRGLLKPTMVQVDTATSGEEALELCQFNKFDLIFLDHMMPGLDGVETFKRLKSDVSGMNYNTPIIVLTANAVTGAREKYMEVGFSDYLTKPINPERLEKSLIAFLPPSKVQILDEDVIGYEEIAQEVDEDSDEAIIKKLEAVPLLMVEDGIAASGGPEIYVIAMEEFALTIENTANLIEEYWKKQDINNYTIQVHGLKSTARIAGDNQLSEMARVLEFAGKEQNIKLIDEKTEELLTRFRELKAYLDPIFNRNDEGESLEMISEADLQEAIDIIKQGLEEFDFDMISSIVDQLSHYSMPDDFKEKYKKLKVAVAEVDFDAMGEIIN